MSNPFSIDNYSRPSLAMPDGEQKLLLHSCCAPCAGEIMEAVAISKIETTVFFYNPNIHPQEEYEIRKDENKRFCDKLGFNFIDADYDKDNWFERIKGLENEPERGARCTQCFDMRFERSALYAQENNFKVYINGSLVASDTSGSVWSANTITGLSFSEINTSAGLFNGKVKSVAVFKEALTDAQLTALTT